MPCLCTHWSTGARCASRRDRDGGEVKEVIPRTLGIMCRVLSRHRCSDFGISMCTYTAMNLAAESLLFCSPRSHITGTAAPPADSDVYRKGGSE